MSLGAGVSTAKYCGYKYGGLINMRTLESECFS